MATSYAPMGFDSLQPFAAYDANSIRGQINYTVDICSLVNGEIKKSRGLFGAPHFPGQIICVPNGSEPSTSPISTLQRYLYTNPLALQ